MKKRIGLLSLLACLLFASCQTTKVSNPNGIVRLPSTISEEIPDSELAKLIINKYVVIYCIDDVYNKSTFLGKKSDLTNVLDKSLAKYNSERTLLLEPGKHIVLITFNNGGVYTQSPSTFKLNLEAGKEYRISAKIDNRRILYEVLDGSGKSFSNPNGYNIQQLSIETYQNVILESVKSGKNVRLSNRETEWLYGPENEIVVTENGAKNKGYIGFLTDEKLSKGTIYIKFIDEKPVSRDEFLNLKPVECDRVYEIEIIEKDVVGLSISLKSIKPKGDELSLSYWGM